MNPSELSGVELVRHAAAGSLSVLDIARSCLARIAELDTAIGAWEYVDPHAVLAAAARLDAATVKGPLHGLPVAVKDIMDTHDMTTSYGSSIYPGHRPAHDAAVVARLRRLGALVVGKSVTTEFAYFKPGKTANPHDIRRTPGGSSSGSAAAVAARMVPIGFGSQTAGSLTRPASYCGVVGFKPSFGRYSLVGVKPLAPSIDTLGWMARTVDDIDLMAKTLASRPPDDLVAARVGRLRIGVARTTAEWPFAESASRSALAEAEARFETAGAAINDVHLPELFASMAEVQSQIMAYETAAALEFEADTAPDRLSPQLLQLIRRGQSIDESSYLAMQASAAEARGLLGKVFGDYDALLTPSAPGEAPLGLGATGDPIFSRMWTLMRVPSITLPGLVGDNGMPVGIQLIGGYLQDDHLLGIAKACSAVITMTPATA